MLVWGIGRSLISGLFVQADSLLALMGFADEETTTILLQGYGHSIGELRDIQPIRPSEVLLLPFSVQPQS